VSYGPHQFRIAPRLRISCKRLGQLLYYYGEVLNDPLVWLTASQREPSQVFSHFICDLWSELEALILTGDQFYRIYPERP
jgi:hypothetical protein